MMYKHGHDIDDDTKGSIPRFGGQRHVQHRSNIMHDAWKIEGTGRASIYAGLGAKASWEVKGTCNLQPRFYLHDGRITFVAQNQTRFQPERWGNLAIPFLWHRRIDFFTSVLSLLISNLSYSNSFLCTRISIVSQGLRVIYDPHYVCCPINWWGEERGEGGCTKSETLRISAVP